MVQSSLHSICISVFYSLVERVGVVHLLYKCARPQDIWTLNYFQFVKNTCPLLTVHIPNGLICSTPHFLALWGIRPLHTVSTDNEHEPTTQKALAGPATWNTPLTFWHRSFIFNSNKSPTWCNSFSLYYPHVCLQLNMFRAFSRPSSGAQWLQWRPLVLP